MGGRRLPSRSRWPRSMRSRLTDKRAPLRERVPLRPLSLLPPHVIVVRTPDAARHVREVAIVAHVLLLRGLGAQRLDVLVAEVDVVTLECLRPFRRFAEASVVGVREHKPAQARMSTAQPGLATAPRRGAVVARTLTKAARMSGFWSGATVKSHTHRRPPGLSRRSALSIASCQLGIMVIA